MIIKSKKISKIYYTINIKRGYKEQIKKIKNQLKLLRNRKTLSNEQKKQIDDFYVKNYGKKIPYCWHEYAYSLTGNFDVKIIPDFLYLFQLGYLLNSPTDRYAFSNKAILPNILEGIEKVKTPKIIASQTNKFNLKFEDNLVSKTDLLRKLENIGECFIKPAEDSSAGRECLKLNIKNGIDLNSNKKIENVISHYKNNFIIQELLTQSEQLKQISPNSVNTFRIITYIAKNEIHAISPTFRFAIKPDSYVDNTNAGGAFISVSPDGQFANKAIDLNGNSYEYSPLTNIKFSEVKIKNFDLIIEKCKEIHAKKLSMLGMISFDVTLDKDDNITIIELNLKWHPLWLSQNTLGEGAFKENTEYMLSLIKNN